MFQSVAGVGEPESDHTDDQAAPASVRLFVSFLLSWELGALSLSFSSRNSTSWPIIWLVLQLDTVIAGFIEILFSFDWFLKLNDDHCSC